MTTPAQNRALDGHDKAHERFAALSERGCHALGRVKGVILAGMHSWGECVLERVVTRPLVPIAGRPLICHTLNWLRQSGVPQTSICANSETSILRRHLDDGHRFSVSLDYYEDVMPRGPAGCVRDAVIDSDADTLVVVEATIFPRADLQEILKAHAASGAMLTIVVRNVGQRFGLATRMLEPAGVYVFSRAALEHVPAAGYQDIKESLIPRMFAQGLRVDTYEVAGRFTPRITGVISYLAVSQWATEQIAAQDMSHEGYLSCGQAWIHRSAKVHAKARCIGPVIVEPGCVVESDAILVGPTAIGEGTVVGSGAVISRSAVWSYCRIGAGAGLDHCVVTDHACLESGSQHVNMVCIAEQPRHASLMRRLSGLWQGWGRGGGTVSNHPRASSPARNVEHDFIDHRLYESLADAWGASPSGLMPITVEGEKR